MNTWAVPLVRYSGPFLKWTRHELKQMDHRKKKLMTMHKLTDYMFQENREEEDLPALTHRYNNSKTIYKNTMEDSLQPSEMILITR